MEKDTAPSSFKNFLHWAIKPPQAFAVYLVVAVLIGAASFYAGTMKPKGAHGFGPPPMNAPRP